MRITQRECRNPTIVGTNKIVGINMKKSLLIFAAMTCFAFASNAQTKKDGTPDMRYSANKQAYGEPV